MGRTTELARSGEVNIARLGAPAVASPLRSTDPDSVIHITIDNELVDEFFTPRELVFETAGPRERLYFEPIRSTAAIVTCGGLCPGINDVIRSMVKTLHRDYCVPKILGIRHGLRGFVPENGLNVLKLTPDIVASIHESGGTFLGTSRGPQPVETILQTLARLNVDMLFIIGGDGTMKAARAIDAGLRERAAPLSVIGIPKTIDNDINFIPRSFGFETAVDKAVEALRCAQVEAMSVPGGIGIVKMMGRESGFITAHSALAFRDADFVLVPEVRFALHGKGGLLEALEKRLTVNGHSLIVLAEGAGQDLVAVPDQKDASGNQAPGDIAGFLMREIAVYLETRNIPYYFKYIDPSYTVRSGPAGTNDRIYCATLGQHAVHAAMSGRTGMAVAEIVGKFVHLPFELITEKRRKMNPESTLWRSVLACTGQGDLTAEDA